MNKQELVDAIVAKNPEITKKLAGEVLGATLDAISDALAKGDSVQLIGFGTFEVKAVGVTVFLPTNGSVKLSIHKIYSL